MSRKWGGRYRGDEFPPFDFHYASIRQSTAGFGTPRATMLCVKIERHSGFVVVGISVRTSNAREMGDSGEIGKLWHEFMCQKLAATIPNQISDDMIAVYADYQSDENGEYTFVLGRKVSSADRLPGGLVARTIPVGRYAKFTTERGPLPQVVPQAWQQIWVMTPEQLGGKRAFTADYEIYGANAADPQNGAADLFVALI